MTVVYRQDRNKCTETWHGSFVYIAWVSSSQQLGAEVLWFSLTTRDIDQYVA